MQAYTYMIMADAPTSARGRILEAAYRLFSERGIDSTTTREIAGAAEVNEVTIFRHFGTKEGLVGAIIDQFLQDQAAVRLTGLRLSGDLAADLEMIVRAILALHADRGDFIRFIMTNLSHRPEYAGGLQTMNETMMERLAKVMKPILDAAGLDPKAAVVEFISPILLRTISRVMMGVVVLDDDTFIRTHVEVFRRAFEAGHREGRS